MATTTLRNVTIVALRCNDCGFQGDEPSVKVHSCYVEEMGGRCEDYPCCGHTDGDGCQTLPSHTAEFWSTSPHLMCDHEAGICEAEYDEGDGDDVDYDPDED